MGPLPWLRAARMMRIIAPLDPGQEQHTGAEAHRHHDCCRVAPGLQRSRSSSRASMTRSGSEPQPALMDDGDRIGALMNLGSKPKITNACTRTTDSSSCTGSPRPWCIFTCRRHLDSRCATLMCSARDSSRKRARIGETRIGTAQRSALKLKGTTQGCNVRQCIRAISNLLIYV